MTSSADSAGTVPEPGDGSRGAERLSRLLRDPLSTLRWTFVLCAAGFFVVGWLGAVDRTLGLSWGAFRPDLGFLFAAAFAQLILAGAVWAQIRAAHDTMDEVRMKDAIVAARERGQRSADAIAGFVGFASNASTLYGHLGVTELRDVATKPGDHACIETAATALAKADAARQAAHAAMFHILVRTSNGPEEVAATTALLNLIDEQHTRARKILAWSRTVASRGAAAGLPAAPPVLPKDVYVDAGPARKRCLDLACKLLDPQIPVSVDDSQTLASRPNPGATREPPVANSPETTGV